MVVGGSLVLNRPERVWRRRRIGVGICLGYFSWGSCFGFFTICGRATELDLRLVELQDKVGDGEADGAVVEEEEMIHTTLHHRTLGRGIRGILERKDGDLVSGAGLWVELLRGTWLGIVVEDRRREKFPGITDGLEGEMVGVLDLDGVRLLEEARARVQGVGQGMRVPALDLPLGGNPE